MGKEKKPKVIRVNIKTLIRIVTFCKLIVSIKILGFCQEGFGRNASYSKRTTKITSRGSHKVWYIFEDSKKLKNTVLFSQSFIKLICIFSIPYHKPKKHTLDEFLKRRTIIQPQTSSPVSAAVATRRLKMTPEELEEYA